MIRAFSLRLSALLVCLLAAAGAAQAQNTINTIAGTGTIGDNGQATSALIGGSSDVAVDSQGSIYITDQFNNRVRRVDHESGQITTFAGTGIPGQSGDEGPTTSAELSFPQQVAADSSGNVYVADSSNFAVRELSGSNLSTIAGTLGIAGVTPSGGPAGMAYTFIDRVRLGQYDFRPWATRAGPACFSYTARFGMTPAPANKGTWAWLARPQSSGIALIPQVRRK